MADVVVQDWSRRISIGIYYALLTFFVLAVASLVVSGSALGSSSVLSLSLLALTALCGLRAAMVQVRLKSGVVVIRNPIRTYTFPAADIVAVTRTQVAGRLSALSFELGGGRHVIAAAASPNSVELLRAAISEWNRTASWQAN